MIKKALQATEERRKRIADAAKRKGRQMDSDGDQEILIHNMRRPNTPLADDGACCQSYLCPKIVREPADKNEEDDNFPRRYGRYRSGESWSHVARVFLWGDAQMRCLSIVDNCQNVIAALPEEDKEDI